jgi:hypothetical protein
MNHGAWNHALRVQSMGTAVCVSVLQHDSVILMHACTWTVQRICPSSAQGLAQQDSGLQSTVH